MLVFDDTGLPKKGTESVGVAAQYCGALGKIGNCQVVVSAQYLADDPASSSPFHFPVSARLYLPESWITDDQRRKRTRVPDEISQQTKPEMALSLLDRALAWGMPIQAVVVDAGYGDNPNFLQGLDDRQIPYVCTVESTFGVRLPEQVQASASQPPTYQGRGQPRKPRPAPLYTVKALIEAQPEEAWQTISWREGTKGTMQAQVVAIRVHWATGSLRHSTSHSRVHTGPEGWLLAERPVPAAKNQEPSPTEPVPPEATVKQEAPGEAEADKTKYWFSTLPLDTSLERLVTLAHARLADRTVLRRCQAGMRPGRLPGARLGWPASAPRSGDVGLQFPRAATLAIASACWRGLSPPRSHGVLCLMCIGRCCSGCSKISSSGSSRPTRSRPSVLGETNEVVLAPVSPSEE